MEEMVTHGGKCIDILPHSRPPMGGCNINHRSSGPIATSLMCFVYAETIASPFQIVQPEEFRSTDGHELEKMAICHSS